MSQLYSPARQRKPRACFDVHKNRNQPVHIHRIWKALERLKVWFTRKNKADLLWLNHYTKAGKNPWIKSLSPTGTNKKYKTFLVKWVECYYQRKEKDIICDDSRYRWSAVTSRSRRCRGSSRITYSEQVTWRALKSVEVRNTFQERANCILPKSVGSSEVRWLNGEKEFTWRYPQSPSHEPHN